MSGDPRVTAIRERVEKATEAPWDTLALLPPPTTAVRRPYAGGAATPVAKVWSSEDAEFIAHAREDVPWLLAELERVTADLVECGDNAVELQGEVVAAEAERDRLREAVQTICERFSELLNAQWIEGYSAAEVERLAEFRETVLVPGLALADTPAAATLSDKTRQTLADAEEPAHPWGSDAPEVDYRAAATLTEPGDNAEGTAEKRGKTPPGAQP